MDQQQDTPKPRRYRGNIWMGCLFLLVGAVLLMRQAGYPFPHWLFSWQVTLITVGIFVGIKNRFRDFSWLIMILIGFVFLSDLVWPGMELRRYTAPIILLILGVFFLFAPKGHGHCGGRFRDRRFRDRMRARREEFLRERDRFHSANPGESNASTPAPTDVADTDNTVETDLDIVSIFGGVKKKVLSKQFRGGEIVCVFGGAQINLSNADFNSPIEMELVQIFGGTKLVVPANWEIRSEIAAIFGGVDDKRPQPPNAVPEKTLILKGTLIFGGVEVNSF
ncbi:MAG: hypothetical protein J7497_00585 [Chitinophagaceae bacterium]|nr:hypothetical protein [Chitinophagaceae bacterium]